MGKRRYRDADWLREQYHDKQLSMQKIADKEDVAVATINKWMKDHGIESRSRSESLQIDRGTHGEPYTQKEWLQKEYVEKEKSTLDIAKECGVHNDTISKYLKKTGVGVRSGSEALEVSDRMGAGSLHDHPLWINGASFQTHHRDGYEFWSVSNDLDGTHYITHHRLLAAAEHGVEALEGKFVHHKNGIRWDNRPENLELVDPGEHSKIHHERGDIGTPYSNIKD